MIATICHYLVLIGLVETGILTVVPASAIGAFVGAVVGYRLNYQYAFHSDAPHRETAPRYMIIAAMALATNTILMAILNGPLGLPYLVAQVITTILVFILTFTGNRVWTFGSGRQK